jgi:spore coat polysaccharide biosynthesis protein SpsF
MNIGALIPVRLNSERLPNKALEPIAGRPMIVHLLDRLFASRYLNPTQVVVCTTEEESDDPLIPVVQSTGAKIFRGSREDIIDRFYRCTEEYGFDAVIQVDGDDPCTETLYMDLCMEKLLDDSDLDVVVTEGLPLGVGCKAIRSSAIGKVWAHHVTEQNDTGFIYFFTRTGLCNKGTIVPISDEHRHESVRLTLDYPEDLAFFHALFRELYVDGEVFEIGNIIALLRSRPELLAINTGLDDQYRQRTTELASCLEYRVNNNTYKIDV